MLGLGRLFRPAAAKQNLRPHALLANVPELDDAAFADLMASIRRVGQQHPIAVIGDEIIDGRARYRACRELGIEPLVKPYASMPSDVLGDLIDGLNLRRPRQALVANTAADPAKITQRGVTEKNPTLVAFVDQFWVTHGRAPTLREFAREFPAVPRSTARGYLKVRPRLRLVAQAMVS